MYSTRDGCNATRAEEVDRFRELDNAFRLKLRKSSCKEEEKKTPSEDAAFMIKHVDECDEQARNEMKRRYLLDICSVCVTVRGSDCFLFCRTKETTMRHLTSFLSDIPMQLEHQHYRLCQRLSQQLCLHLHSQTSNGCSQNSNRGAAS
ncbi:hypothetical protein F2P81_000259 [Scophthalmus maximus]|uniref:Uncharacterized protein n=1 Tax=Scophthalmus maximus TaxID=52904 RepID=A0A6A4TGB5_SCOMX|nr:hypothetical protein F2P81_000259 [Scophthalmus maximus]